MTNTRPKILFITSQYPPQLGGVARAAARNLGYLTDYQVVTVSLTNQLALGQVTCERQGENYIYRMGASGRIAELLRLFANLIEDLQSEFKFDLIIGFYLVYAGYLAAFYGRRFHIPSLVAVRGNDLDMALFTPEQLPFVEWAVKNANIVACVTLDLAAQAAALSGRSDIGYAPNSVDSDFWRPVKRDEQLFNQLDLSGKLVLGFVGELRAKKAPGAILQAFTEMRKLMPTKLLLIGGARHAEQQLITSFQASYPRFGEDIIVIDYVEQEALRQYYSLIDIVLFPSLWEGMSNALLEAMAMERLVIASDVGGNKEVIESEKNGFLLPRAALDRLGEKIYQLTCCKSEHLHQIAIAARQRVVEYFAIAKEQENLLAAISQLLGR